MNICVIEDDPDCYEGYEFFLSNKGNKVTVISDADQVVDDMSTIIKNDVILLDIMLRLGTKIGAEEAPETGLAIYRRIRALNKDIRIVVITARDISRLESFFGTDPKLVKLQKPIASLEKLYQVVEAKR